MVSVNVTFGLNSKLTVIVMFSVFVSVNVTLGFISR
jgi:hypothetical protein